MSAGSSHSFKFDNDFSDPKGFSQFCHIASHYFNTISIVFFFYEIRIEFKDNLRMT